MRQSLPAAKRFIGKEIPGTGFVITNHIDSGSNGHVYRGRSEDLNLDCAIKLIPKANIALHGDAWKAEAQRANHVDHRAVVRVNQLGIFQDQGEEYFYFIADFIEGKSLRQFISSAREDVTLPFIEYFIKEMIQFLDVMERRRTSHGDLHVGNIIVQDRRSELGDQPFQIRITDFSSASTSEAQFKDDLDQLAAMVRELLACAEPASARDKFSFDLLQNEIVPALVERDLTRSAMARNLREIYRRVTEIDRALLEERAKSGIARLAKPFDYLNCEQFGSSAALLNALYSNLFLGLDEIESNNNLVVTGPRGCGKSTVFKSLSTSQRILVDEPIKAKSYIGIYYQCLDLHFSFPRYRNPISHGAIDIPLHFLTATLLLETMRTIELLRQKHQIENFDRHERVLIERLWVITGITVPTIPYANTNGAFISALEKERRRATFDQKSAHKEVERSAYFGADILVKAVSCIQKTIAELTDMPFFYFIDDYSSPKVTQEIQRSLNRMLFLRNPNCFFKISTESPVSYAKGDCDGKEYVENREYALLNIGNTFIYGDAVKKGQFIEDVFNRRLAQTENFPVSTIDALVGSKKINHNEMAREIRKSSRCAHWGKEVLPELCSGDIHYIINLVGRMVSEAGGATEIARKAEGPRIATDVQNKCIRDEAGRFLSNLSKTFSEGKHLVDIVTAFGQSASYLLKKFNSKNEKDSPPWQAARIELYDSPTLSPAAGKMYMELLRYSLFIEDYRGKSIRGNVVPRLVLRRFLIPHFNLTFSGRDSISMENADLQYLLERPLEFVKHYKAKDPSRKMRDSSGIQMTLFTDDKSEK